MRKMQKLNWKLMWRCGNYSNTMYDGLLIKCLIYSDAQQKCLNESCHVSDKTWSTFGIKPSCFSFSIHPSCNSFRKNETQKHEREEKEDNDKDEKCPFNYAPDFISVSYHLSLFPREITGICFILKVDWHKKWKLAVHPGITPPPQQSVIESEL